MSAILAEVVAIAGEHISGAQPDPDQVSAREKGDCRKRKWNEMENGAWKREGKTRALDHLPFAISHQAALFSGLLLH
jgi:hypothetical protein